MSSLTIFKSRKAMSLTTIMVIILFLAIFIIVLFILKDKVGGALVPVQ